jgi:hypothetical protein
MKNYFYIVTAEDGNPITSKTLFESIYDNVLLKYHFPTCQLFSTSLDDSEKQQILTDEISIIRTKLHEVDPTYDVFKIPRILYDFFFFLYFVKVLKCKWNKRPFRFDCYQVTTFREYAQQAKYAHAESFEDVYALNNFMIEYMHSKKINIIKPDYLLLLSHLHTSLKKEVDHEFPEELIALFEKHPEKYLSDIKTFSKTLEENIGYTQPRENKIFEPLELNILEDPPKHPETIDMLKCLLYCIRNILFSHYQKIQQKKENHWEQYNEVKTSTIQRYIYNLADNVPFLKRAVRFGRKYVHGEFGFFLQHMNMRLIYTVLISEISETKAFNKTVRTIDLRLSGGSKSKPLKESFYLYRATDERVGESEEKQNFESPIDGRADKNKSSNRGYSLSYNTAIFNGLFSDRTACTYHYMNEKTGFQELHADRGNVFKNKYILHKFFFGDESLEDQLFFIPPLLPLVNLFCSGELWHARSKIYLGSKFSDIQNFAECFEPERLEDEYQNAKDNGDVDEDSDDDDDNNDDDDDDDDDAGDFFFPSFLKSLYDKEEMVTQFRKFVKNRRFTILGDVKDGKKMYNRYFTKTKKTYRLSE